MKNFTYKLTATTFFSPVSITAENELDAIQELMDFYENGVLEIEDENFDLDKTAETQAYTPMVTPPPVIENGYVPLSSLSSSQDTYFGDDEEDDGDLIVISIIHQCLQSKDNLKNKPLIHCLF